jgi:hypothetical protein
MKCKWTNRTYNLLELLSEKYDCEKEQEKEGDQYATAEDIFGVLESVNENRRRIVEIERKQNDASEDEQSDRRALKERVSDLDKYIENLQKRVFDLEYKHKEPIV